MIFKNKEASRAKAKKIKAVFSDNDGTLTPGHTFYSSKGEELKMYSHRDGRGISLLKENGIIFGIITGEQSKIVTQRAMKLNIEYVTLGAKDKVEELKFILTHIGLKPDEIAYIGDDTNDLEISEFVGLSAAVSDAHPDLLNSVDLICSLGGGSGAVREFIDFIISEKQ